MHETAYSALQRAPCTEIPLCVTRSCILRAGGFPSSGSSSHLSLIVGLTPHGYGHGQWSQPPPIPTPPNGSRHCHPKPPITSEFTSQVYQFYGSAFSFIRSRFTPSAYAGSILPPSPLTKVRCRCIIRYGRHALRLRCPRAPPSIFRCPPWTISYTRQYIYLWRGRRNSSGEGETLENPQERPLDCQP